MWFKVNCLKEKEAVKTFFEWKLLENLKHNGFVMIGADKDTHSVAEHSLQAAQIGYVLAVMENYKNPEEVAAILVFHDIGEVRTGDLNYIARQYVKKDEEKAVREQISRIVGKEKILDLWMRIEHKSDNAGIIAKDADYLEQALTARTLVLNGYKDAQLWIDNGYKMCKTKSAKKLMKELNKADPNKWWREIVLRK